MRGFRPTTSTSPYSLEEIKKYVEELINHKVQWVKNDDDGRKNSKFLEGRIYNTYNYLFAIKLKESNRIVCFSFNDLFSQNIVLISRITGKNILDPINKNKTKEVYKKSY
ncbi:MAG: Veg family protein [archaeon]